VELKEFEMNLYTIRLELELDEPSGVYTVTSPDVSELITEGSTPEEILHNVQEVLEDLFEIWAELGQEIPTTLQRQQTQLPKNVEMLVAV
jgi:predicted RNase H-like HicB family nuclease